MLCQWKAWLSDSRLHRCQCIHTCRNNHRKNGDSTDTHSKSQIACNEAMVSSMTCTYIGWDLPPLTPATGSRLHQPCVCVFMGSTWRRSHSTNHSGVGCPSGNTCQTKGTKMPLGFPSDLKHLYPSAVHHLSLQRGSMLLQPGLAPSTSTSWGRPEGRKAPASLSGSWQSTKHST